VGPAGLEPSTAAVERQRRSLLALDQQRVDLVGYLTEVDVAEPRSTDEVFAAG